MRVIKNSSDVTPVPEAAVEVHIWKVYLLRNNTNVRETLFTYSLDNGPLLKNDIAEGSLIFRFTRYDWDKTIRRLLVHHQIHYSVGQNHALNFLENLLKKKIFVVEGDPDILFALNTVLEEAGYQVTTSPVGKPVIEGSFSHVDLFIIDRHMPDFDGLDLCSHLRAQSSTKATPVILLSGTPNSGNEALQAGANDYLEKPFHMHYLLNVVARYTRYKDKRAQDSDLWRFTTT